MIIQLSPIRDDDFEPLTLERQGSTLIINGEPHDITALAALEPDQEGMIAWPDPIVNVRDDTVTVLFPYNDPDASEAVRFPVPITDPPDGPIPLPTD